MSHPLCGVWTCESKAFATVVKHLITNLQIEFTDKTARGKKKSLSHKGFFFVFFFFVLQHHRFKQQRIKLNTELFFLKS